LLPPCSLRSQGDKIFKFVEQLFCSSASNAARANSTCQPVSQNSKKPESKKPGKHGADPPKFKLVHKPRRNPTLLENLLSSEISHERSEILQCVKYVCDQNFFGIGKKTT
jgi:hypothetical protein